MKEIKPGETWQIKDKNNIYVYFVKKIIDEAPWAVNIRCDAITILLKDSKEEIFLELNFTAVLDKNSAHLIKMQTQDIINIKRRVVTDAFKHNVNFHIVADMPNFAL